MSEPSRSAPVGIILAVDPDRFTEVVEALRRAGLTVTGEQPMLGTLSGTVAEDRIPALETVDGVDSVDRKHTNQLPRRTPRTSESEERPGPESGAYAASGSGAALMVEGKADRMFARQSCWLWTRRGPRASETGQNAGNVQVRAVDPLEP